MYKLLPSILSANFANLENDLMCITNAGVTEVHIDVMDGTFVPSISLGFPVITSMRKVSNLFFDVHLMVDEPVRYIEEVVKSGADRIGIHVESSKHLHRTIQLIRSYGKEVCVVLNPATPLSVLEYILNEVDVVLLMTVNPGFGGQDYIPNMTQKIKDLKNMISERNISVQIAVDGGVKLNNIQEMAVAGAELFVAGSSIFNGNTIESIQQFQSLLSGLSMR